MTRDDIIRMAREAGGVQPRAKLQPYFWRMHDSDLERFFHMAYAAGAAAERNKLPQWMIQHSYATGHGDTMEDLLKELEWQIRESEREACAKVCDKYDDERYANAADLCANAIRARSKA
jgi:hypothetical protein